ncbi:hypothetical protein [Mesobacillus foraminis]|uniref:Uncharacterized protein n=1 Tax=Mesobacillus foraminis TaxID=279826 RepID=A0A4R2B1S9_9BACI|nr:hypothetical protein [Mesobacillus foraminis]TCN20468.1 hypothetical protein EV146_11488 [Mesobacillus foraminis]
MPEKRNYGSGKAYGNTGSNNERFNRNELTNAQLEHGSSVDKTGENMINGDNLQNQSGE